MASTLLADLRVVELGRYIAAPYCGRLLADLGADVIKVEPPGGDVARQAGPFRGDRPDPEQSGLFLALNLNKRSIVRELAGDAEAALHPLLADADVLIVGSGASGVADTDRDLTGLRRRYPRLVITSLTPFGRNGPYREFRGSDLVAFHLSGYAPLVPGPVDDPEAEPPLRAGGHQAEFVTGLTGATATLLALALRDSTGGGSLVDVSAWEAMAMMPQGAFAAAAQGRAPPSRLKSSARTVSIVAILPTADGYIAISPREEHQWQAWLEIIGRPVWSEEERFKDRHGRQANWAALEPLLAAWTRTQQKQDVYRRCQDAHVPAFPVNGADDLLSSEHLRARGFFREIEHPVAGKLPYTGAPFKLTGKPETPDRPAPLLGTDDSAVATTPWRPGTRPTSTQAAGEARLPLAGVRVLDFSWIIAGPTCTRLLAVMGAEVIKVESSRRPDPSRTGNDHPFLSQSKRSLALNVRSERGLALALDLAAKSDVVVENFATGVIERLGLGYEAMRQRRPDIIMLSSSGLGHTGPDRDHVAYGSLLQCFTGWSRQTGYPGGAPRIGGVWSDPLTGMIQTFLLLAALRDRERTGEGTYIDLSMAEAICTLLPEAFMEFALNGRVHAPIGNADRRHAPHNLYRCRGDDAWVAIAVTSDAEWLVFCDAIGRPDLAADPRFAMEAGRLTNAPAIDAAIGAWTATLTPLEVTTRLQPRVACGPSLTAAQALSERHLLERGFFAALPGRNGGEIRLPGVPWQIEGAPPPRFLPAADLGRDSRDVLHDVLGLTDTQIDALERDEILR